MRTQVKKILDGLLHPLGINVERHFGSELALKQLVKMAHHCNADLLLDIGANTGQFAKKVIDAGFTKKLISFEPLSSAYPLLQNHAKHYANWEVFDRCAIGDTDGDIEINISHNSHSSSILEVSKAHIDAAPSAAFYGKEHVPIRKLDSIAERFEGFKNIVLKIDTQGFESHVIRGAEKLVNEKVCLIQLELSLLPLYEGVMPFEQMITFLNNLNFVPVFYSPGYIDRTTDQIQQLEGFFVKKDLAASLKLI
jgi:FkbM family methyltransferase